MNRMDTLIKTRKHDSLYEKIRKINTTEIYRQKDIPLLKEIYETKLTDFSGSKNIFKNTGIKLYQVIDDVIKKIPRKNTLEDESKIAKLYLN